MRYALHRVQGSVHVRVVAGGGVHWLGRLTPKARPTLCGDCDQRHGTDWEEAWPNATRQEQESAVPEQKATGWLSRLRR